MKRNRCRAKLPKQSRYKAKLDEKSRYKAKLAKQSRYKAKLSNRVTMGRNKPSSLWNVRPDKLEPAAPSVGGATKFCCGLSKTMSSLALLKREWPKGIYVTEGKSGSEVLSRLGRQADDLSVQVLAELPGLEENLCVALWRKSHVLQDGMNVAPAQCLQP